MHKTNMTRTDRSRLIIVLAAAFTVLPACGPEPGPSPRIFDACKSPRSFLRDYARESAPSSGRARSAPGFLYGINYPWRIFAGDFGGIRRWNRSGVAGSLAVHRRHFRLMKKHGVRVLRWWLWPDFRGDGIRFSPEGKALGLGGTVAADLRAALQLAHEFDMHLILVIFSFDNFRPTRKIGGIRTPSMAPMLRRSELRRALIARVVSPLAKAVHSSPRKERLLAWELINEPEWAMKGRGPGGDRPFYPLKDVDPVEYGEMTSFLAEMIAVLRGQSRAPITIGQAAAVWGNAFRNLDLDFYQYHVYNWMGKDSPLQGELPAQVRADKPVLIGELPLGPLHGRSFARTAELIRARGFAGALPWSFSTLPQKRLRLLKGFPETPCSNNARNQNSRN